MPDASIRFVHASDFHLEQPLHGVAEVPDHLRDLFLDAAYHAAEQVFETALAERVDFLVLAGDLLDERLAGPRGASFLTEQFTRLAERGISVYWALGHVVASDGAKDTATYPSNVHRFDSERVASSIVRRDDHPIAQIVGKSGASGRTVSPSAFRPEESDLFSVAVTHGELIESSLAEQHVDYLALGGRHAQTRLGSASRPAWYPGTPQGRSPQQAGPHGCVIVEVDMQGNLDSRFVPTDVVRWSNERIEVDDDGDPAELIHRFHRRLEEYQQHHPSKGIDMLISWTISGSRPDVLRLHFDHYAAKMLDELRAQLGRQSPAFWSVSLEVDAESELPAVHYDQDTILGDFLRRVREYVDEPEKAMSLEALLPASFQSGEFATHVLLDDPQVRRHILQRASILGADLLGGENYSFAPTEERTL